MLNLKQLFNIITGLILLAFNLFMISKGEVTMAVIFSGLLLIRFFNFLENL